jgi:hypothetical protein
MIAPVSTPVKPPSFASLDPELKRGRLKFERRITILSLLAGFPAVGFVALLLWYDGYSAQVQWTVDLLLVLLWLGIAFNLKRASSGRCKHSQTFLPPFAKATIPFADAARSRATRLAK